MPRKCTVLIIFNKIFQKKILESPRPIPVWEGTLPPHKAAPHGLHSLAPVSRQLIYEPWQLSVNVYDQDTTNFVDVSVSVRDLYQKKKLVLLLLMKVSDMRNVNKVIIIGCVLMKF